jgi:hypothetical protein
VLSFKWSKGNIEVVVLSCAIVLTYPDLLALGRENFLTSEADRTLSEMTRNVSEPRAISALITCANHKSQHVRARVASHLDCIVECPGTKAALLSNWTCLERLFKTVCGFLNEGEEIRHHAVGHYSPIYLFLKHVYFFPSKGQVSPLFTSKACVAHAIRPVTFMTVAVSNYTDQLHFCTLECFNIKLL